MINKTSMPPRVGQSQLRVNPQPIKLRFFTWPFHRMKRRSELLLVSSSSKTNSRSLKSQSTSKIPKENLSLRSWEISSSQMPASNLSLTIRTAKSLYSSQERMFSNGTTSMRLRRKSNTTNSATPWMPIQSSVFSIKTSLSSSSPQARTSYTLTSTSRLKLTWTREKKFLQSRTLFQTTTTSTVLQTRRRLDSDSTSSLWAWMTRTKPVSTSLSGPTSLILETVTCTLWKKRIRLPEKS